MRSALFHIKRDTTQIESGFAITNTPLTFLTVEEIAIDFLHPVVLDEFGPAVFRPFGVGAGETFFAFPDTTTFRTTATASVIAFVPEPDAFVVLALATLFMSVAWRRASATARGEDFRTGTTPPVG